jgi:hypothetical protein
MKKLPQSFDDLYVLDAQSIVRNFICGHCMGPLEMRPSESGKKDYLQHPLMTVYCPECGKCGEGGYTPMNATKAYIMAKEEKLFNRNLEIMAGVRKNSEPIETIIKKLWPD